MNRPIVSIIVPNFNHKKYLKHRLDSIINQTYQDFEILIFDDASTDDSLIVLNTYKSHPKVSHFIVNAKNSGSPFLQWTKGIKLAKGEFVWIAETDDFAEPNFLEETVKTLNLNANANLVYTDSRIISSTGKSIGTYSTRKNNYFKTQRWSANYMNNGLDEILNFILYKVTVNNASAVLFRRKNLLKINLIELGTYKNVGDMYTYCNVLFHGNISYISMPLNNYRLHATNITKINEQSGAFYNDALRCYTSILISIYSNKLSVSEISQSHKVFKFIVNRFVFRLLDFDYGGQLRRFLKMLLTYEILTKREYFYLILGSKLYQLQNKRMQYKIKNIFKKLLVS